MCASIRCHWPVSDEAFVSFFECCSPGPICCGRCLSHSHDLAFQISWLSIIEIAAHPSQMISHFDYASIVTRLLYWFHRQLRPFFLLCLLKSNFSPPPPLKKKLEALHHPPVQVVRTRPTTHSLPARPLIELGSDAKRMGRR